MNTPFSAANDLATPNAVILVVDDCKTNIQVVGSLLSDAGYEIMPATSGSEALARLQVQVPDLILLDLMMPEMDGLEVCRRLKNDPITQEIPVIFLTASNEMTNLVEAFDSGAVDYVTKPFNTAELMARVKTHLELKQTREALVSYSNRLRELNLEKNEFMGIAAHDLRNPLNNIMGCLEVFSSPDPISEPARANLMEIMTNSVNHMLHLVESYLDVSAIESGQWKLEVTVIDLRAVVESVVESFEAKAAAKQQNLSYQQPEAPVWVELDHNSATEVAGNLISNAIKYCLPGKNISVQVSTEGYMARLAVQDDGPGLTDEDHSRLFTKFARLSARPTGEEQSTGLGLSIVKKMVEMMHGRVWCESKPGEGATFLVEWPLQASPVTSMPEDRPIACVES
jgi:two-component system, sensor histidine kinase and response regulator